MFILYHRLRWGIVEDSFRLVYKKPKYSITLGISKLLSEIVQIQDDLAARLNLYPWVDSKEMTSNRLKILDEKELETINENLENFHSPEIKNIILAYNQIGQFDCYDINSLKSLHALILSGIIPEAGQFREDTLEMYNSKNEVILTAPAGDQMIQNLENIFCYLKEDGDSLLIKAPVFLYEYLEIHPFWDGNGRAGRFWLQVLLAAYNPIYKYILIENQLLKERNSDEYHYLLNMRSKVHDATLFIELVLKVIKESLIKQF